jgi:hypothetical protein
MVLGELLVPELVNKSPLSFRLELIDGVAIETAGEAAAFFGNLSDGQKEKHYWKIAIRMLNIAVQEPAYLKTATMSLQTALLMEGILLGPPAAGAN